MRVEWCGGRECGGLRQREAKRSEAKRRSVESVRQSVRWCDTPCRFRFDSQMCCVLGCSLDGPDSQVSVAVDRSRRMGEWRGCGGLAALGGLEKGGSAGAATHTHTSSVHSSREVMHTKGEQEQRERESTDKDSNMHDTQCDQIIGSVGGADRRAAVDWARATATQQPLPFPSVCMVVRSISESKRMTR